MQKHLEECVFVIRKCPQCGDVLPFGSLSHQCLESIGYPFVSSTVYRHGTSYYKESYTIGIVLCRVHALSVILYTLDGAKEVK